MHIGVIIIKPNLENKKTENITFLLKQLDGDNTPFQKKSDPKIS